MTRARLRGFAPMLIVAALTSLTLAASAAAAPPQEVQQPSIEGDASEGKTLTADVGRWSNSPTSYAYQWQRCDENARSCTNITGAREKTYQLASADVGKRLVVLVTASNADGSTTANSTPTLVVTSAEPPRMNTRPSISGKAEVGEELTANPGTWTGFPRFSYQWQRCDENGANCASIAGGTTRIYGVRTGDKEHTLRVVVTARTGGGTATGTSDRTGVIGGAAAPPVGVGGALSITAVSLPNRLVISSVQFEPRTIRSRSEPLVARFRITEQQGGRPVVGALVYAIGVPFNRVSSEGERQTDAQGWATFNYSILRGMPIRPGESLVMFVRARKPGDNILAGVSSRRLVSIRVSR